MCHVTGIVTADQIKEAATWCLVGDRQSRAAVALAARDHAMLLLSTGTAFRGDNIWQLEYSDLFRQHVRLSAEDLDDLHPIHVSQQHSTLISAMFLTVF